MKTMTKRVKFNHDRKIRQRIACDGDVLLQSLNFTITSLWEFFSLHEKELQLSKHHFLFSLMTIIIIISLQKSMCCPQTREWSKLYAEELLKQCNWWIEMFIIAQSFHKWLPMYVMAASLLIETIQFYISFYLRHFCSLLAGHLCK